MNKQRKKAEGETDRAVLIKISLDLVGRIASRPKTKKLQQRRKPLADQ